MVHTAVALVWRMTGHRVQQRAGQRVLVAAIGWPAASEQLRRDVQEVVDDASRAMSHRQHPEDVMQPESAEQRARRAIVLLRLCNPDAERVHRAVRKLRLGRHVQYGRHGGQ